MSQNALVSDIKTCTRLTDGRCQTEETAFAPETPEIIATSIASDFPVETTAVFVWSYAANGQEYEEIERYELTTKAEAEILSSSLSKLDSVWPSGAYKVELIFPAMQIAPLVQEFAVITQNP